MLSEHAFNIRFVVHGEHAGTQFEPPAVFCDINVRGSVMINSVTWLGINLDRTTMLFHHDVVAHRQAKPGALASRFGRRKGIEYLLFYLRRNSHAIVADADFDLMT